MRFGRTPSPIATASSDSGTPTPEKTLWGFVKYLISDPQEEVDPEPSLSPTAIEVTESLSESEENTPRISPSRENEAQPPNVPTSILIAPLVSQAGASDEFLHLIEACKTFKHDETYSGAIRSTVSKQDIIEPLQEAFDTVAPMILHQVTTGGFGPETCEPNPSDREKNEVEVHVGSTEGTQTPTRNSFDAGSVFVSAISAIGITGSVESSEASTEEVEQNLDGSDVTNATQPLEKLVNVSLSASVHKLIDNRDTVTLSPEEASSISLDQHSAVIECPRENMLHLTHDRIGSAFEVAICPEIGESTRSGDATTVHCSLDSMENIYSRHALSGSSMCKVCRRNLNLQDNSKRRRFSI
jgi:hypothetical protein